MYLLLKGCYLKRNFSYRNFATVTTVQGALIIGGYVTNGLTEREEPTTTVACYSRSGWSRLDDLQSPRHNGRAIVNGDKVYIIGGSETQ